MRRSDAPWDWARFARFVFLGGALVAPVLHTWYDFLGRAIKAGGAMGATLRCRAWPERISAQGPFVNNLSVTSVP